MTSQQALHERYYLIYFWMFFFFFLNLDPGSVNLEKVVDIIIDQSLKDQVFSKEAGRICYTIVQVCTVIQILFGITTLQ